MPATISHSLSMTTPNDPAYENQPQHWNQPHAFTISATGSEIAGAFSNANGLSFGLSAGAVTGSYTVPSVPSVTEYFSRTNTTFNGANISGSITNNTNGLQLSLSVGTGGGDGVNIIAAGTQTANTTGTVVFSNSNGISFGLSNSSVVTASYTVPTQSNQTGGIYHVGNTIGQSSSSTHDLRTLSIDGAGIVSAGWSNGSIRISATQSNQAFSADASSTFQTLSFQNSNGISFSNNAGAIRLTHELMFSTEVGASASNGSFSFKTINFSNANNVTFGTSAGGIVTASVNAGGGGIAASLSGNSTSGGAGYSNITSGTMILAGGPNITLSQDGSKISISANAPGAAAENNWVHLLGANTKGNTTASGSTIGLSGINLTLSGTNNSVINIVGDPILSGWVPYGHADLVIMSEGNQSLYLAPHVLPRPVQFDRIIAPQYFTQATNSTLTASKTIYWGLFTKNGATLSLVWSTSGSFSVNGSGTASSSANSGIRYVTLGQTTTVQPGNYWIGMVNRSSTAGANATFSMLGNFALNSTISGYLGVVSVTNNPLFPGLGVWTSTTNGIPGSVAFSDIRGNSSAFQRPPHIIFTSGTW